VDRLAILQEVNSSMTSALLRLRAVQTHCSSLTADDFAGLMSEILRGAECLRLQPIGPDAPAALCQAALDYRANLEKLRDFLPQLHLNLLAEKSRLESAQARLKATAAWARSSTQTL